MMDWATIVCCLYQHQTSSVDSQIMYWQLYSGSPWTCEYLSAYLAQNFLNWFKFVVDKDI